MNNNGVSENMNLQVETSVIDNRNTLFRIGVLLFVVWGIMTFTPLLFKDKTGRLFADYFDRGVYYERGKWFTEGVLPISEYPQIPTWLFGFTHLSSKWVAPALKLDVYVAFFSLEMILVLFLVIKSLLDILPLEKRSNAFLMLLPPVLYFTYNRFDILPAYACVLAYQAAIEKKWSKASFFLALGTFTKWYPVLLFPGLLMYAATLEKKFQWNMFSMFGYTSIVILTISYLQGGVDVILAPYQLHASRSMEFVALPVLLNGLLHSAVGIDLNLKYLFLVFFIIQLSGPILLLFIKVDSLETLTQYYVIATGLFVLFSRIWSPQWLLWMIPFLVISAKNLSAKWLIVAYSFLSYLSFPIFLDYFGTESNLLRISASLTYILLFYVLASSFKKLILSRKKPVDI